uniref:Secreted protein n=1 Tax=Heterorhabditis bacteriophora TaxID=37862 RepID=A0A1I7WF56_HETBA
MISQCLMKTNSSMLVFCHLQNYPSLYKEIFIRLITILVFLVFRRNCNATFLERFLPTLIYNLLEMSGNYKFTDNSEQSFARVNRANVLRVYSFVPGVFKFTAANMRWEEAVSFGDFSRIFAHCHFNSIWISEVCLFHDMLKLQYNTSLIFRHKNVSR